MNYKNVGQMTEEVRKTKEEMYALMFELLEVKETSAKKDAEHSRQLDSKDKEIEKLYSANQDYKKQMEKPEGKTLFDVFHEYKSQREHDKEAKERASVLAQEYALMYEVQENEKGELKRVRINPEFKVDRTLSVKERQERVNAFHDILEDEVKMEKRVAIEEKIDGYKQSVMDKYNEAKHSVVSKYEKAVNKKNELVSSYVDKKDKVTTVSKKVVGTVGLTFSQIKDSIKDRLGTVVVNHKVEKAMGLTSKQVEMTTNRKKVRNAAKEQIKMMNMKMEVKQNLEKESLGLVASRAALIVGSKLASGLYEKFGKNIVEATKNSIKKTKEVLVKNYNSVEADGSYKKKDKEHGIG